MKNLSFLLFSVLLISCGSTKTPESNSNPIEDVVSDPLTTEKVTDTLQFVPEDHFEFAVSNKEGTQIKVLNSEFNSAFASEFKKTLGIEGNLIPIEYLKQTAATEEDNHRQSPYNFENLLGWLYDVNGEVEPWNTALLFRQDFLDSRTYIHATELSTVLTRDEAQKIESDKGRKITRSEEVTTYPGGMSTHFVEFEARDSALLVSFIMKEENGDLTYYDFAATKGEYSCWRVDDGCEFEFELFPILAVFKGANGYELFTTWIGAEGSNSYYLVQEDGVFIKKKAAYYYQAPL